ncbi:MucR family transcriptional regulator (plasmid) [Labrenzia sp. 5N]|jgi:predicted transcriptional regulator|uniref:MucR family transcriptional regulator n=1 Tax=Stappiaceae TaxID=2821832 RepID=UPI00094A9DC8|nr:MULTISPECIES: MucR family transcriptional regulator [Stappiaceae]MBO9463277.1 MucR family transcriptional regulator [Labrenzia sp. R5_0]NKX68257.1 MucR family transcriptional regulator [Labrenzia sp. 5N]UES53839.1 MucR family transcriptional regulator [Roseibium aggregatum]UFI06821.1 MucR family transcriptional regulator [Roseibium aggregatum]
MSETPENNTTIEPVYVDLTADIVSAYVSNNTIASGDLAALIATVHSALVSAAQTAQEPAAEELVPAVPVKKSVLGDYIICLEDGKRFKSLKRHLRTHFDMTPEDYRAKWNLPADYPMVAPNYAAARSDLARKMGLGQKQGRRSKLANKS